MSANDSIIDNIPLQEVPPGKVFDLKKILLGVFVGGPLVAGYMFYRNFHFFKETKKGLIALLLSVVFLVFLFWVVFKIPDDVNFPDLLIPAIYTGLTYFIFQNIFLTRVNAHTSKNGATFSWAHTILASLISLVIYVGAVFAIFYSMDSIDENRVTKTYGSENKCTIEYNTTEVDETFVDELAAVFTAQGLFVDDVEIYIPITKNGNVISFPLSFSNPADLQSKSAIEGVQELRDDIDKDITQYEIHIDIIDEDNKVFKTLKP